MTDILPTIEGPPSALPSIGDVHRTVVIQKSLLAKNSQQAQINRHEFCQRGVAVINLLSSPGSGKTKLLERTLDDYGTRRKLAVLVGDLQTENDAARLEGRGHPIVAITTGTVCHLEAEMVSLACREIELAGLDLLAIENVGNLVCPASFDLGEDARVVILSTTEGEDKPLKYPKAFKTSQLVVINKCDLVDAVGFDRESALSNIRQVAPQAQVIEVSARTGVGMEAWYDWLEALIASQRANKSAVAVPRSEDR
jgi:hydrogenase nickel incorporation protein HypB